MAAVFYALHSIVVMTALYFAAGLAARAGGSSSLAVLGGIYRSHPFLAALSLMLFFSVSGLPPFSGFWPKVMLVKAALDGGAGWLAAILLFSGFVTTIATARIFLLAYWRPAQDAAAADVPARTAAVPRVVLWPLVGLTLLSLAVGLYPQPLLTLVGTSAATLIDPAAYIQSVFPAGGVAP